MGALCGVYLGWIGTTEQERNLFKLTHDGVSFLIFFSSFISASAGTYANLVKQAKSKQKIIDKMEAAGLIKPVQSGKALNFRFEDVAKLPPPIIAFSDVAFAYSGKKEDYLYKDLSFGIDMDSRIAIVSTLR